MIYYREIDIFNAPVEIIVHQANCFCTMGSGIAKEIKKRYPRAFLVDKNTVKGDAKKLGQFTVALANKNQDKTIINLYGQYAYGKQQMHTNYLALTKGFNNIKDFLNKFNPKAKVGIPHNIGCGLGGGDWSVVEGIIQSVFRNSDIEILICSYTPKVENLT